MKTCTKCKQEKELTEFGKRKSMKDGHKSSCKHCECVDANQRRKENPIRSREIGRKSRLKNVVARRDACRKWRLENLDKSKDYNKKYKQLDKSKKRNNKYMEDYRSARPGYLKEYLKERKAHIKEMRELQEEAGFEQC